MIEISCPQCNTDLEIDEGFAGGICRCFNCGALMTVPDDPELQAAEYLTQPGRPARPEAPTPGRQQAPMPSVAPQGPQTFVTSTGRQVQVSEQQLRQVPVARRRRVGVRATVITIFLLVIFGIGGAVFFLIYLFYQSQQPESADDIRQDIYVVTENPYLAEKPALMAFEGIDQPVTVIVDGSSGMRDVMYRVVDLFVENLRYLPPDMRVQLLVANDGAVRSFPQSPMPVSAIDREALSMELQELRAGGAAPFEQAFENAVVTRPASIIFVTNGQFTVEQLARMRQQALNIDATLHLLHLQLTATKEDELMEAFVEKTGGRRIPMDTGQLEDYYDEWRDKQYE